MNKKFTGLFLIISMMCTVSLFPMESLGLYVWQIDPIHLTSEQVATMRASLGTAKMVALCPSSYQYWGMVGVLRARGQDPRALIAAMPDAIKHDARKVSVQQIETSLKRLLGQKNMTVFDVMHAWACLALLQEKGSNPEAFVASLKTKLSTARIPQAYTRSVISKFSKCLAGIRVPQVRAQATRSRQTDVSSEVTGTSRATRATARPVSVHEDRQVAPVQRQPGFARVESVTSMEQPLRRTPHVAMPEPVSHSEPDVLSERSEETLSMQGTEEQEERLAPEIQELQGEVEHTRDELAGARRQIELLRAENDELRRNASPEQTAVAELRAENNQLRDHIKRLELNFACEEGKARVALQAARKYAEEKAAVERQAYREKVVARQEHNEELRRLRARITQLERMSESEQQDPPAPTEHALHPDIDPAYVADLERQLQETQLKAEITAGVVQELLVRGTITEADLQSIAQDIQGAIAHELQDGDGVGTSSQEGHYEDPE
jgi:hypothetical protein